MILLQLFNYWHSANIPVTRTIITGMGRLFVEAKIVHLGHSIVCRSLLMYAQWFVLVAADIDIVKEMSICEVL
jgi:hypothetical protein